MTKTVIEFICYAVLFVCEFVSALAETVANQAYDFTYMASQYLDQLDPQVDMFIFMIFVFMFAMTVSWLLVKLVQFLGFALVAIWNLYCKATRIFLMETINSLIYVGEKTCFMLKTIREKI